jgi:acetyl esterase/lipase
MVATAQQELPLYGGGPIPNSKAAADKEMVDSSGHPVRYSLSKVSHPTLTVYLPAAGTANGTAVVICPGGGYTHLAFTHEGTDVARMLNEMGIAAFVLKYRMPSDETMADKTIGPLQDAQRAIQLVRQRAADWGMDTGRVGISGFRRVATWRLRQEHISEKTISTILLIFPCDRILWCCCIR